MGRPLAAADRDRDRASTPAGQDPAQGCSPGSSLVSAPDAVAQDALTGRRERPTFSSRMRRARHPSDRSAFNLA
jgi:hypothetical protein